jgi:hypothetical protein
MTLRPIHLSALAVAAVLAAGCDVRVGENGVSVDVASGKAQDEWSRSYTVTAGGTVEVINFNGPIVVEAATGSQVEVKAIRQARAGSEEDAQALLRKVEIKEEVAPGRVAIQTANVPGLNLGRRSVSIEYRLKVPAGLHVSVKTENGGVGLHDVDGTIAAATTNGGVRGTNLSGAVSAHIVNGGIVMDVARVSGPIELESVNGGIRLDLPPDVNADLDARVVNGGIVAEDDLTLTASEKSRTRVTGKFNRGGPAISASTVNGGVRIGARKGPAGADR